MWPAAFLLAVLVPPLQGQSSTREPRVEIGLHTYRSDGRESGSARVQSDGTGYVWIMQDYCGVGAASEAAFSPSGKILAWRLASRTIDRLGDQWVLQVEWHRAFDAGVVVQDSPRTSRITLRTGERVLLDSVSASAPAPCAITHARLEVGVGLAPIRTVDGAKGLSGAGGGRVQTAAMPSTQTDMWLVHTRPDGTTEDQRISVGVTRILSQYEFSPLTVEEKGERVSVQVRGTFQPKVVDGDVKELLLTVNRTLALLAPPYSATHGGTVKTLPLPASSGVIGLEIPSGALDLLPGHRFSLRLRVRPSK